jgi:hypothetical protein
MVGPAPQERDQPGLMSRLTVMDQASRTWITTFLYDHHIVEDLITSWADELDQLDGSAAVLPHVGYTVTLWIDTAADPFEAADLARERAVPFARGDVIGVETVSVAEYARRANASTIDASTLVWFEGTAAEKAEPDP